MTQHFDEVARAILEAGCLDYGVRRYARAAMRAVVKQMREPSAGMIDAGNCSGDWGPGINGDETDANPRSCFKAMVIAYAKEAGIDE